MGEEEKKGSGGYKKRKESLFEWKMVEEGGEKRFLPVIFTEYARAQPCAPVPPSYMRKPFPPPFFFYDPVSNRENYALIIGRYKI